MKKHTVLIPVDESPLSAQILPVIERFFKPEDAELLLFQTVNAPKLQREDLPISIALTALVTPQRSAETYQGAKPIDHYYALEDELLQQHQEVLSDLARSLAHEGFDAKVEVTVGDPAEQILQRADDGDIDLIAMSTHGRQGFSRLVKGSVAQKVIHEAPVPVLVFHPTE